MKHSCLSLWPYFWSSRKTQNTKIFVLQAVLFFQIGQNVFMVYLETNTSIRIFWIFAAQKLLSIPLPILLILKKNKKYKNICTANCTLFRIVQNVFMVYVETNTSIRIFWTFAVHVLQTLKNETYFLYIEKFLLKPCKGTFLL